MKPEAVQTLQNGFIALAIGLALPPAIGFGFGLWVTKADADRSVNEAVLSAETTICVAQFTGAPGYQERLKEYKALDYTAKSAYFERGNWGRMPGEEKARKGVMEACASKLDALAQK